MAFWDKWQKGEKVKVINKGSSWGNAIYCLGGLGVLIYYLQQAQSITAIILAFIKAIFWPAFLVFRLYGTLGMN